MSTAVQPAADITITAPTVEAPMSEAGAVLQIIERAARDPSVDIGKMRELLAMRNEMMAFEAKREYQKAMTAAQTEMRPVAVDASNPQTRSRYATFHALDGALRPIYTRHGFSLSFGTADGAPADHIRLTCQILHDGGHVEVKHLDMPSDGKGAKGGDVMTKTHATGAAVTYGRRYLEGMIFNIAISQDDDGNSASSPDLAQSITADQFRELQQLLEESNSKEADMLKFVKAETVEGMTLAQYAKAKAIMVHKIGLFKQKGAK
jgi:hypothetical protein